jgi:hypothetical protein
MDWVLKLAGNGTTAAPALERLARKKATAKARLISTPRR